MSETETNDSYGGEVVLTDEHFQWALQAGASEDFVDFAREFTNGPPGNNLRKHIRSGDLNADSDTRNFNFIGSEFAEALWYEGAAKAYEFGDGVDKHFLAASFEIGQP